MHLNNRLFCGFIASTAIVASITIIYTFFQLNDDSQSLTESHSRSFKILLWTPFFGIQDYVEEGWQEHCAFQNCEFTSKKDEFNSSDVVIFHVRDVQVNDIPLYRPSYMQRWVLFNHESPPHTPKEVLEALNGLINWTATYREESEILLSETFKKRPRRLSSLPPINHNRSGMVFWLVSNCETPSKREDYVKELAKYIPINIYGKCGNKTCLPKMSQECYEKLSQDHYFYLAFENSICKDYVTEKFFFIVDHQVVPIVLGGADYDKLAPSHSAIDALKWSPKDLAQYLRYLIENPKKYDRFFEWKKSFFVHKDPYPCQICTLLNTDKRTNSWNNLIDWWFGSANCRNWTMDKNP